MKRIVGIVLVILCLLPVLVQGESASTGEALTFNQYLAEKYLNFSEYSYVIDEFVTPSQSYVESFREQPGAEASIVAWEILSMGTEAAKQYTSESQAYYAATLYDIIYGQESKDCYFKYFDQSYKMFQISMWKDVNELAEEVYMQGITDKTVLNDDVMAALGVAQNIKDGMDIIAKFGQVTKYAANVGELINKISQIKAADLTSAVIADILYDMSTTTDDASLKVSLEEMAIILSEGVSDELITAILTTQMVANETINLMCDMTWKLVKAAMPAPIRAMLEAGQAVGKFASNVLFSTDKIIEGYHTMVQIVEFGESLRTNLRNYQRAYEQNPSDANAIRFNQAVLLYYKTLTQDIDSALRFYDTLYTEGLLNKLYGRAEDADYQKIRTNLLSIKSSIETSIVFQTDYLYNEYIELYGDNVPNEEIIPVEITVTEEEVDAMMEEMKLSIILVGNNVIVDDIVLTDDYVTYGSLEIKDGSVDLNGHTLSVGGDLLHGDGDLMINGGTLEVGGDYLIADSVGENWAGEKEYGYGSGELHMQYADDTVRIYGDFVINSISKQQPSAGTIYLAGDFYSDSDFSASDEHTIVFNGSEEQHIYFFVAYGNGFANVRFENPNICLDSDIRGFTLQDDIELKLGVEELEIWDQMMDLNGHSLSRDGVIRLETRSFKVHNGIKGFVDDAEVAGDVEFIDGTVDLNGHTLRVGGNLLHSGGDLLLNGGTLEIAGDFVIAGSENENAAGEEEYYRDGSGVLHMQYAEDTVRVGGDFITSNLFTQPQQLSAGTIYLAGDYRSFDYGGSPTFSASGEHTIVFNGSEEQHIYFKDAFFNGFAKVRFENPNICLDSDIRGFTLQDDIELRLGVEELQIYGASGYNITMDLNGHSLSKDGVLRLETLSFSGYIKGFADDIEITGDAEFGLGRLDLNGRTLRIGGNLLHSSGDLLLNGGTLEVAGNYVIAEAVSENGAGEKEYTSGQGRLYMEQAADTVRVQGDFAADGFGNILTAGTMYLAGDLTADSGDFDADGEHTVVFNGIEEQHIYFNNASRDGFANVHFENPNICLDSNIRGFTLQDDINLKLGVEEQLATYGATMDLNGHSLSQDGVIRLETLSFDGRIKGFVDDIEIAGDAELTGGRVDLNGRTLRVGGNLLQSYGDLVLNGGTLDVAGDYVIAGSVSENSAGEKEYMAGSGELFMEQAADTVRVGGDFATNSRSIHTLTAGTMYFAGDLTVMSQDICASGTHVAVLDGDAHQTITFVDGGNFNILRITKGMSNYTFSPENCWNTLEEAIEPQAAATFPEALTEIRENALLGAEFEILDFSNTRLTKIGNRAFQNMAHLTVCIFPETVSEVGEGVFDGCDLDNLTVYCYAGSAIESYARDLGVHVELLDE